MADFEIYSHGLCYMSVCTNLTKKKDIEYMANKKNPTYCHLCWTIDEKGEFADGTPMPCKCEKKPETHKHYLLSC